MNRRDFMRFALGATGTILLGPEPSQQPRIPDPSKTDQLQDAACDVVNEMGFQVDPADRIDGGTVISILFSSIALGGDKWYTRFLAGLGGLLGDQLTKEIAISCKK